MGTRIAVPLVVAAPSEYLVGGVSREFRPTSVLHFIPIQPEAAIHQKTACGRLVQTAWTTWYVSEAELKAAVRCHTCSKAIRRLLK